MAHGDLQGSEAHARAYKHVYRAMAGGRGGVVASNEMRRVLADLVRGGVPAMADDEPTSRELAVCFVVATFLMVLSWLLERKPLVPPAEADRLFRRLVLVGIGPWIQAETIVAHPLSANAPSVRAGLPGG